jgi:hypothetical protein
MQKDDKSFTDKNDNIPDFFLKDCKVIREIKKNTFYRYLAIYVYQVVKTEEVIQGGSFMCCLRVELVVFVYTAVGSIINRQLQWYSNYQYKHRIMSNLKSIHNVLMKRIRFEP